MGSKDHTEIIVTSKNTSIIEDTYMLAGLLTFDPSLKYNPRRDSLGNVSFEVEGKISDVMGMLYEGKSAPLNTYIKNLKALRTAIFALKGSFKSRKNQQGDPS